MARTKISEREVTATSEHEIAKNVFAVAPGVWRLKDVFVNVFIIENSEGTNWILVDAGLKTAAPKVKKMAAEIFGSTSKPSAIILTHGHFDHVGSIKKLAEEWGCPVYCHHLEVPYLTGKSKYPPADPGSGGGMMSFLSFTYPRGPINIQDHLRTLDEDGTVPEIQGWQWIHTPGHAPGHVSLYREEDGVLIAGDAMVTTNQQSAFCVMTQRKELNGPPRYFTMDWGNAARSAKKLAALSPQVVASGHGPSMYGAEVRKAMNKLVREFWDLAMPRNGRYVHEPALANEEGITYVPPARNSYTWVAVTGLGTFALAVGIYLLKNKKRIA